MSNAKLLNRVSSEIDHYKYCANKNQNYTTRTGQANIKTSEAQIATLNQEIEDIFAQIHQLTFIQQEKQKQINNCQQKIIKELKFGNDPILKILKDCLMEDIVPIVFEYLVNYNWCKKCQDWCYYFNVNSSKTCMKCAIGNTSFEYLFNNPVTIDTYYKIRNKRADSSKYSETMDYYDLLVIKAITKAKSYVDMYYKIFGITKTGRIELTCSKFEQCHNSDTIILGLAKCLYLSI